VNLDNWIEGNAMAIIISGSTSGKRVAVSYDGNATKAPKLIVEYSIGNDLPTIATPTILPNGGTFTDSVSITLASATDGAVLFYTLDGSEPTESDNQYSVPFDLTSSATLKVKGFLGGYNASTVSSASFTIESSSNTTPTLSVIGNQSTNENQLLTIDVTASDIEGPAPILTADLSALPAGDASFTDNGDGSAQLTWTPVDGDATSSPYAITISATDALDATLVDSETFNVTVRAVVQGDFFVESQVASSNDDAEENASGSMYISSSDIELVQDRGSNQTVGLRFTDMQVPQGATITNAYLEFQVDETNSGSIDLLISGQANSDVAAFGNGTNNITNRTRTSATVSWDTEEDWTTRGVAQQSPNISNVIQEIVNQDEWVFGNAMGIIITGSSSGKRVAVSYDGNAADAAKLIVEYNIGNDLPTVATPSISPNGGTFTDSVSITLASATDEAVLFYTLDGSEPTESDYLYTTPFDLTNTAILKVKGFLGGYNGSAISNARFVINSSSNTTPTLSTIGNQSVNENQLLIIDVNASDVEGPEPILSIDLSSLPVGDVDFVDNGDGSGQFTWTPNIGDAEGGPYSITVTATDGLDSSLSDSETFDISVSAAQQGDFIVESQVASSNDDAEENSSGSMYIGSSDLELVQDGGSNQTVGMRFTNMSIPQNAIITNAYLEFQVDEFNTSSIDLVISGQANGNVVSFGNGTNNITNRARTSAGVAWINEEDWTSRDAPQQSPNISPVIQEIVNLDNWIEGNAMAIIISGSTSGKRVAVSYDGNATKAPKLIVEYSIGG